MNIHLIIPDIDQLIIQLLDIRGLINLAATNKHFHKKITSMDIINQCKAISRYKFEFNLSKFSLACMLGYQSYAQYLFDHYEINIDKFFDTLFIYSCNYGQLNIAKWLLTLDGKIDIHAFNDNALKCSIKNNNSTISKWLINLGNINHTPYPQHLIDQVK